MDILSTLFHQQSRKIGMIVPCVVISEKHTDMLEITDAPRDKCTNFREINYIAAAFQYLKKNYNLA